MAVQPEKRVHPGIDRVQLVVILVTHNVKTRLTKATK
jgi:hypothetical protein